MVKNLPTMVETRVQSLGWENPLEKEKWQPIPVFLLGEFHGQRSLAECIPWGQRESDPTEGLTHTHTHTHMYKIRVILATEDFCEN